MKDVTNKPDTLRTAQAQAVVTMPEHCVRLITSGTTEKGNALEAARYAGLMAAKRTSELIPLCHSLAITGAEVEFKVERDLVRIVVSVRLIGPTGAEMEALTGASVAALTLYDMLKPHANMALQIRSIELLSKHGGKSEFLRHTDTPWKAAILVISDSVSTGQATDTSGACAHARLQQAGLVVSDPEVCADDLAKIMEVVRRLAASNDLLVCTGGTGIGARDQTPDAVLPLIEREIPGLVETARAYGQRRTPYAMLSRAVAGVIGQCLVLTTPGSRNGVSEALDALIPGLLHALSVLNGNVQHHQAPNPR